jgi:hypothetical protein
MRKKKAMQIMSATAVWSGEVVTVEALRTWWMTEMGMGLTRDGGGSARV